MMFVHMSQNRQTPMDVFLFLYCWCLGVKALRPGFLEYDTLYY